MVITFFDPTNQEGATGGTVSGITLWSDEYTKEYIDDVISEELSGYTKTIDFATINGSAITEGGNLIIEGGGGGATGGTISGITLWSDETTEEYVDCRLSSYTQTIDFATINGSAITEGGNLIIEGGSGGTTYSAGTNIDITNNVISVTGISDTLDYLQTQINGNQSEISDLWEETNNIWNVESQLENMIYDVQPVEVNYKSWYWNEDYQNWDYDDERDFTSLDDIYDYIRECQRNGFPLYNDNGTYGVSSNFIDGKRYIFTSPVARYESLVDPDRKEKEYKTPNEGKLIVRKHLPAGIKEDGSIRNPIIGSKYFFDGETFFDVYLPNGQEIYIDGVQEDEIELAKGYGNEQLFDGDYVTKPNNFYWNGESYVLQNTYNGSEVNWIKYVIKTQGRGGRYIVEVGENFTYIDDDMGYLHLDLNRLTLKNLNYNDDYETNSLGFYFEQGRLKCNKPTRFPIGYECFVGSSTSPIVKESEDTYVWRAYQNHQANERIVEWFYYSDCRKRILQRKHRSFLYKRSTRESLDGTDIIKFKILDGNTLAVTRKKTDTFYDTATCILTCRNLIGDFVTLTINNPFTATDSRIKYYTPSDVGVQSFAGLLIENVIINYEDDTPIYTQVNYDKKKSGYFTIVRKNTDIYWRDGEDWIFDNSERHSAVVFKIYNKYKGVKTQVPMYFVIKPTSPESRAHYTE